MEDCGGQSSKANERELEVTEAEEEARKLRSNITDPDIEVGSSVEVGDFS